MKNRLLALDRRFVTAAVLGSLISLLAFAALVTAGTFNLKGPTNATGGATAAFYDAQAKALLHGDWNVPPESISGDAFVVANKSYGYFGPTPALLRMPILFLAPRAEGHTNAIAFLSATTVILVFTSRLVSILRRRALGEREWTRTEAWYLGGFLAFLVPATTLMFLASFSFVYHEAIIWGLAFALSTFYYTVRYLENPSWKLGSRAIVTASLALLTRPSTGLSALATVGIPIAILLFTSIHPRIARLNLSTHLRQTLGLRGPEISRRTGLALAGLLFVPVLLSAAINLAKFGNLTSVPYTKHQAISADPARLARLNHNGGLLNPRFIPTTTLQYFRPDALRFGTTPPWISVRFGAWSKLAAGSHHYDGIENHTSIPATMPALTALALLGTFEVFRRQRRSRRPTHIRILRTPILGAATGTLVTLSAAGITHRYLADFLVVLIPLSAVGLVRVMSWNPSRGPLQAVGIITLVVAALFGTASNVAIAVDYQNTFSAAPPAARIRYAQLINNLDHVFDTARPTVYRNPRGTPPVGARAGSLWLPAGCGQLLWSDGTRWLPLSSASPPGAFEFDATFEPAPVGVVEPILVHGSQGAADLLNVRHVDDGSIVFFFDHWGALPIDGIPVAVDFEVPHRVVVEFNPQSGRVVVIFDGIEVLNTPAAFYPGNAEVVVGRNNVGASALPRFKGRLRPATACSP